MRDRSTYVLAILVPIAGAFSAPARAEENPYRSHDPFSYYSLIMDPAPDNIERSLGPDCVGKLRAFFSAGGSLFDAEIRNSAVTVEDFSYTTGRKDALFYHHTDRSAMRSIARENRIDKIYSYLRTNREVGRSYELYVAEDPTSSIIWGDIMVRLALKPGSLVFLGERKELIKRHLSKQALCNADSAPMAVLAMEENGIALHAYRPSMNRDGWFLLVRPDAVAAIQDWPNGEW